MVKIIVDMTEELSNDLNVFKAINRLKTKEEAIIKILTEKFEE